MNTVTKTQNRKITLSAFRAVPLLSSTEVATATNLSRSTAHRAIEFLRKKNLLLVSGKRSSGDASGKKPLLLCINANYRHIFCVDIQIAGLHAGIADLKGKLLAESTAVFKQNSSLDSVLSHMESLYTDLRDQLNLTDDGFAGMAVGSNGVVDMEKGIVVSAPNFPSWGNHVPLLKQLNKRFGHMPTIFIDNSNRFSAYAEYRVGQARGNPNFFAIAGHHDGFGGGLVVDGSPWRGRQSLAGEIGHVPVDGRNGRICACGARGCLEATASMKILEKTAMAGLAEHPDSMLATEIPPSDLTYKKIYAAAAMGDKYAKALVKEQGEWLAMGINSMALLFSPGLVILQGNFKEGGPLLLHSILTHIAKLGLPRIQNKIDVVYSHLGNDRCLIGQAHFIADAFFEDPALYT